jgi:hypothetical protein
MVKLGFTAKTASDRIHAVYGTLTTVTKGHKWKQKRQGGWWDMKSQPSNVVATGR